MGRLAVGAGWKPAVPDRNTAILAALCGTAAVPVWQSRLEAGGPGCEVGRRSGEVEDRALAWDQQS